MGRQLRNTLTTQFLQGPPPDADVFLGQPERAPERRTPIPRLGFFVPPKMAYDPTNLAERIRNASVNSFSSKETLFICDTNVFIEPVANVVWEALLETKILMIPAVWQELQNVWISSPTHNSRVRDILKRDFADQESNDCRFTFFQVPTNDSEVIAATEYYVNLLAIRKKAIEIVAATLRSRNGKQPTEAELQRACNEHCGERGYQLAARAAKHPNRPFPFADEELVVTAVMIALFTGNEVVLLTRDAGVQEQFYKFIFLLDTHYRGMLLAQDFATDSAKYRPVAISSDDSRIAAGFMGSENLILSRTNATPHELLQAEYEPLPLHCWLFGDSGQDSVLTMLNFCAEIGMRDIVRTKGRTAGRNTDRLGRRNCHIYLFPLPFEPLGAYAIVGDDRASSVGKRTTVPWLDLQQSLFQSERFRRVLTEPIDSN